MKTKFSLTCLILLVGLSSYGQFNQYDHKRELSGIKDQWNKIVLPDEIYGKVTSDLSDIRIFGLSKNKDTIEAPYILKIAEDKISEKEVSFNLINQSNNDNGYYFTFEVPADHLVNQMNLEFKQENFDWRVALDGSQNLREWFSIIDDYRILSIKNYLTDFQFTKVAFPDSKYRSYRLLIKSDKKPELVTTKISWNEVIDGNYSNYDVVATKIDEYKKNKQTVIDLDLKSCVPVSYLKIFVKDKVDYYRPLTIKYLSDSAKTEQGWQYYYSTLISGTLNSIESTEFKFNSTILKRLKIIIDNENNAPLKIDSFVVKGYIHELIGRFTEPATYFLIYGNKLAAKPNYDIDHFADKIPSTLQKLSLGTEQFNEKEAAHKQMPLFQNKLWLWTIMAIIIVLLGWFSFTMIRKK